MKFFPTIWESLGEIRALLQELEATMPAPTTPSADLAFDLAIEFDLNIPTAPIELDLLLERLYGMREVLLTTLVSPSLLRVCELEELTPEHITHAVDAAWANLTRQALEFVPQLPLTGPAEFKQLDLNLVITPQQWVRIAPTSQQYAAMKVDFMQIRALAVPETDTYQEALDEKFHIQPAEWSQVIFFNQVALILLLRAVVTNLAAQGCYPPGLDMLEAFVRISAFQTLPAELQFMAFLG